MSEFQGPVYLRQPKGRGGVGGPRAAGHERKRLGKKDKITSFPADFDGHGGLKRVSKRGRMDHRLMEAAKVLVIQEYSEALNIPTWELTWLDLEHIHGRNDNWFPLGAKVDFLNLQLLPRKVHELKTNPPKWAWWTSRLDLRPRVVEERLIALSKRVQTKLGPAWTWAELLKVLRGERFKDPARDLRKEKA